MKRALGVAVLASVLLACGSTSEPSRLNGFSVHLIPKSIADADESGSLRWGFMVSQTRALEAPADRKVFESAAGLFEYFLRQSLEIRNNGIWLVLTNPRAYTEAEEAELEDLKRFCLEMGAPLFITRARDLPGGWERVS